MQSLPDRPVVDQVIPIPWPQVTPIPWPQFKADLLGEYKPPVCSRSTQTHMIAVLKALESIQIPMDEETWTNISTTADLTPRLIADYCARELRQSVDLARESRDDQHHLFTC